MELMLLSLLLPVLEKKWELSKGLEASIASVSFFGILCGAFFWGYLSDSFGRKIALFGGITVTAVFGLISAFSPSIIWLILIRWIVGFGIGSGHIAFSLFAELLPPENRGTPMIYFNLSFTVGAIIEAGFAWFFLSTGDEYGGWRGLLVVTALPLFSLLFFWRLVPESPRFLLVKGKVQEAKMLLNKIAIENGKSPLKGELWVGKNEDDTEGLELGRIKKLYCSAGLQKLSLLIPFIWAANNLIYYGLVILTPHYFAAIESSNVYLNVLITNCAEVPGLLITGLLVDKGRILVGTTELVICGICILGLILPFSFIPGYYLGVSILARASSIGAFAIVWLYTPEVYPTVVRSTALGLCQVYAKTAAMGTPFVSIVFGDFDMKIPIIIFASMSFVAAFFMYCLPIETAGRALPETVEDVEESEVK